MSISRRNVFLGLAMLTMAGIDFSDEAHADEAARKRARIRRAARRKCEARYPDNERAADRCELKEEEKNQ